MKALIALLLLTTGISATALTEVTDTFAGPYRIGRMDRLQSLVELKDMVLSYSYKTKAGAMKTMMVNAAADLSDYPNEGSIMDWLAEQKRNYVLVTMYYDPGDVSRTDNCLGSEFIYKVEDEDGNEIETCFSISPRSLISE